MPFAAARLRFRFDLKCVIDDRRIFLKRYSARWKKRAVRSATSDENGIPESKMPMVLTFVL
eukprot:scaffold27732_cov72-Skeletonema_dohrnii-CCMP3373.AAC.3